MAAYKGDLHFWLTLSARLLFFLFLSIIAQPLRNTPGSLPCVLLPEIQAEYPEVFHPKLSAGISSHPSAHATFYDVSGRHYDAEIFQHFYTGKTSISRVTTSYPTTLRWFTHYTEWVSYIFTDTTTVLQNSTEHVSVCSRYGIPHNPPVPSDFHELKKVVRGPRIMLGANIDKNSRLNLIWMAQKLFDNPSINRIELHI